MQTCREGLWLFNHYKKRKHYRFSRMAFVVSEFGRGGGDRKQQREEFHGLTRNPKES